MKCLLEIAVANCAYAQEHNGAMNVSTELWFAPAHLKQNKSVTALKQLPALLPAQIDTFLYRIHMSPAFTQTQVSFTSLLTGLPITAIAHERVLCTSW